jgi:hypothetical protein
MGPTLVYPKQLLDADPDASVPGLSFDDKSWSAQCLDDSAQWINIRPGLHLRKEWSGRKADTLSATDGHELPRHLVHHAMMLPINGRALASSCSSSGVLGFVLYVGEIIDSAVT